MITLSFVRFSLLALFVTGLVFSTSCDSTSPVPTPIAGRTFELLTVEGRSLPTTIFVLGRFGSCDAQPVRKVSLIFGIDGSFAQSIMTGAGTTFSLTGSYTELIAGERLRINSDIATVNGDTIRVRLSGANCGNEEFVAVRI